ncbi:MAG: response regulator [Planctomycetes bacterium]|nr:response regulator [Planctomycetota bacterium]
MTILFDSQKLPSRAEQLADEPAGSGSSPVPGQDLLPGTNRPSANEGLRQTASPSGKGVSGTASNPSPGGDGEIRAMIVEASSPSRSHAAPAANPPRILVVDDEPLIRDLLSRYLESQGFRVLVAASGREAVERFRNERAVGLVLLDVRMPGLDGPATLAALRCLNPQVRCCFMSGDLGSHTTKEIFHTGALALFEKPLHLSELAASLHRLLGSPAET